MSIVFTISEAFGSGKSSVVNLVCKLLDGLDLAIPYTTRTPHIANNQDRGFVFTSREVFELMIAREEFLEYVSILGNYYGTPARKVGACLPRYAVFFAQPGVEAMYMTLL